MPRLLLRLLGVLELTCAIFLVGIAWQLPGPSEVRETANRLENVSRDASRQVEVLRQQCIALRERQPALLQLTRRLETQLQLVAAQLKGRSLQGNDLDTITQALGQIADGLDAVATSLDPKGIATIGKGFGVTASYLDHKLLPAAETAAQSLLKTSETMKVDTSRLSRILEDTPVELKTAKAMMQSLKTFEDGLDRLSKLAKVDQLQTMREGFTGLQTALSSGADQVDKMSKYTMPKVSFKDLQLKVEEKDFWPDAKTVAQGMRTAAKGCEAAGKELQAFQKELPRFRASLEESRKVVTVTRQALEQTLAQQEKLEPVLERLPRQIARLASDLPQLAAELARILRETARLKEVASSLREAEKAISTAALNWPALRTGLTKSATLLRTTQKQLQGILANREDYQSMLDQSIQLTSMFAQSLPVLLQQLESGLEQQEESLANLGDSIDQVSEAIPGAAQTTRRLLRMIRLLLLLVAITVLVHAGYLLFTPPPR